MIGQTLAGVRCAVQGARFLAAHPRLWGWVVAPYLVTLGLFVVAAWLVVRGAVAVAEAATRVLPGWLDVVLGPILAILVTVGFAFAVLYVYVAVATLVASPFCELLAEAAEEAHTGRPPPAFSVARLLADLARTISQGLRRTLRYLVFIAVLGVLSICVPGPGTGIVALVGLWGAARFVAWDCLDWTLARRGLGYRAKAELLDAHRARTTGLGLAIAGGLMIPLVGPLFLPIGAVGGMLLVTDLEATRGGTRGD